MTAVSLNEPVPAETLRNLRDDFPEIDPAVRAVPQSETDTVSEVGVGEKVLSADDCEVAPVTGDEKRRLTVELDEIVFKAGNATIILKKEAGGVIEIRAPKILLEGDHITSIASGTNMTIGTDVVSEAGKFNSLLGKLIKIDGQCVKINC